MVKYLKTGKSGEEVATQDAKIRKTVEEILDNITKRGDAALREYSQKFDDWNPESFRLTDEEIQSCYGAVSEQVTEVLPGYHKINR